MDRKILALEATRDLTKTWAHVDMDAFYAAAEELANPSLVTLCRFMFHSGLGSLSLPVMLTSCAKTPRMQLLQTSCSLAYTCTVAKATCFTS